MCQHEAFDDIRDLNDAKVACFWWQNVVDKTAEPTYLWTKADQIFWLDATIFEKQFSTLIAHSDKFSRSQSHQIAYPVVDESPENALGGACNTPQYPIIAHRGWFRGDIVRIPKDRQGTPLNKLLADGIDVRVSGFEFSFDAPYAASEEKFLLVTDIDGRVIWDLGGHDIGDLDGSLILSGKESQAVNARDSAITEVVRKRLGIPTAWQIIISAIK
jgi:hypothetical protein